MYERFSDKARRVMQLANQEAQRFNHEYIGTEHILLGIVKEGSSHAADLLKHLDVDLRKIRLEVEKLVQSGPDMVTMGKLPMTPRAKRCIELAMLFARELNYNYIGTEHILVGLLREKDGVASQVLEQLNITEEMIVGLLSGNLLKDVLVAATISDMEAAVENQDFEKATKIRESLRYTEATLKKRADVLDAALWRISTVLTNHILRNEDRQVTIDQIRKIVEDTYAGRE